MLTGLLVLVRNATPAPHSAVTNSQPLLTAPALHGGCVVAVIHHATETHIQNQQSLKQPDILNLHVEFLRACERCDSVITVTPLKLGSVVSTFQVELAQGGKTKVVALATSTNFDYPLGPTVSTAWTPLPPPRPKPDFERVLKHQPDPNWVPAIYSGEFIPFTGRMLILDPREGFPTDGICDAWNGFEGTERIDSTTLAFMTDLVPSMSDTLLHNGGIYDAHAFQKKARVWADKNPGVPAPLKNSIAKAMKATTLNQTATLDVEFKRRLPVEGLQFAFMRTTTKMLRDGRMDVDLTIHDQDMELVCTSRQVILVLEAQRKFNMGKPKAQEKL